MTKRSTIEVVSAVRTWNRPHTKATVTVTFDDGDVCTFGGQRAANCNFVVTVNKPAYPWLNKQTGETVEVPAQAWVEGLRTNPVGSVRGTPATNTPITEG